jgi:hypothetical protein
MKFCVDDHVDQVDVLNSQLRSEESNSVERAKVQSMLMIEAKSRADAEERLRSVRFFCLPSSICLPMQHD